MNIRKNFNDKELTVCLEGRLDTITSQDLNNEINNEMGNFNALILDLSNLKYISSAGIRVLIIIQKKLNSEEIPFVIKNVNDVVNEIFRMSGFDKILKIE